MDNNNNNPRTANKVMYKGFVYHVVSEPPCPCESSVAAVGLTDGPCEGLAVGAKVGLAVGAAVGVAVGDDVIYEQLWHECGQWCQTSVSAAPSRLGIIPSHV